MVGGITIYQQGEKFSFKMTFPLLFGITREGDKPGNETKADRHQMHIDELKM